MSFLKTLVLHYPVFSTSNGCLDPSQHHRFTEDFIIVFSHTYIPGSRRSKDNVSEKISKKKSGDTETSKSKKSGDTETSKKKKNESETSKNESDNTTTSNKKKDD